MNFFSQNSILLFGVYAYLQSRCLCQKQPCTKITVRYLGNTISGFPGRSLRCSRNLYPELCTIERTFSSGLVSLLFIRDIFQLLCPRLRLSIISWQFNLLEAHHKQPWQSVEQVTVELHFQPAYTVQCAVLQKSSCQGKSAI